MLQNNEAQRGHKSSLFGLVTLQNSLPPQPDCS